MTQTVGKAPFRLRALFIAAATAGMMTATMTATMATPAQPAPLGTNQPRIATPEQMQQFNQLETELNQRESAYTRLQQQFDLGQLSAEQYRAAVAALDAKQPAPQPTTAVPVILRPRIIGCSEDGYSVAIPLNITVDTGAFAAGAAGKGSGAMAMHAMERLDQALQAMIRDTNIRMIAATRHDDIVKPAFKTAIDAALAHFSTTMSTQMHVAIKATAEDIISASTSNCLIQPNAPASTTPSP
jgi:hypothetical protein